MALRPHFALLLLVLLVDNAWAFGAGNILSSSYLEGKAFHHGDIEDVLAEMIRKVGGGTLGFLGANSKFVRLDIRCMYFG